MKFFDARIWRPLIRVAAVACTAVLLSGCGGNVTEEEYQASQRELQSAQAQIQSLQAEKRELQTKVSGAILDEVSVALSLDEIMDVPPTVVELTHNSAAVRMITKVPTTCAIALGTTTQYGLISVDDSMMSSGHTFHYHTLDGLQPDTVYHYKWGLLGPDGTLFGSEDLTFKTPPAGAGSTQ